MKEFTASIGHLMARGLRPDDRMPRNSGFLTTCQNVRIVRVGDEFTPSVFTPVTDPFAAGYLAAQGITISHPFPQIFKGREETLLLTATGLYEVTEGANWTLSPITTKDAYAPGTNKSIITGESWHLADFGGAYVLFNGSCVVFKTNRLGMFGATSDALVLDDVTVNTGCAFRGRMVMGGFNSSDFWNDHWDNYLRSLFTVFGLTHPSAPGTNFVWWSPIGSGAFFLFYPDDYISGLIEDPDNTVFSDDNSMLNEIIERNEMGFMPMNWQGTVRRVLPLGNGIMVYGDNGISYMPKAENTFGLQDLLPYGIESRSSVGGSEREHVFVDEAGWLWRVQAGQAPVRLGFREYFENMIGNDIVVSYDPIEDEYHISDDSECFVLTRDNALYESTFLLTSTAVYSGGVVGVYDRPGDSDDAYAVMVSDIIDLGLRSIKTIERILVSATNTTDVSVAIDWRNKSSDSWTRTPYFNINYEGVAYFPVMGLEFRIVVRCADYTKMDVDDVRVQFKTNDKRVIRGTYALENVARTNY